MIAHAVKKSNLKFFILLAFETILRFLETTNIIYSKLRSQGFILQGQQITGAPGNDGFLSDPLKRYFRLSGVPLKALGELESFRNY